MERVTFIVPSSGQRIGCLLNPEHLEQHRRAGIRRPLAGSGPISGASMSDELLLHTGGGSTYLDLELLFDITLVREAPEITDVRQLTKGLWELAENELTSPESDAGSRPLRSVRFVWGKAWNVLGVIESVAERLERFDQGGAPARSWLRMRLRRIPDPTSPPIDPSAEVLPDSLALAGLAQDANAQDVHVALGQEVTEDGSMISGERLDELASRYYGGRPWLWRLIAAANDLDHAPWAPAGVPLTIPEAREEPR